jgi:hypothetical protein
VPISYSIDHQKAFIVEVWTGDIFAKDLAAYWRHYLADPAVLAIRRTLVDLRQCNIQFTGSELSALVNSVVIPILAGRDWKTAIVVDQPAQFGVSRQYHVFAQSY